MQTELAYGKLREMIIGGQLAPGSWLIEADLSARLGVSRTPVRAALLALQKEGYVKSSGSGAKSHMSIAPLTNEDAQELYAILGRLEGFGARQTAQLPRERRAEIVKRLGGFDLRLRSDPDGIFELDLNFHRTVVEASAGPRLLELHRTVQPQAERYWRLYAGAILNELSQSVQEHSGIAEAIDAGDPDAAECGIQLNWTNGAKRLAKTIQALGERGSW